MPRFPSYSVIPVDVAIDDRRKVALDKALVIMLVPSDHQGNILHVRNKNGNSEGGGPQCRRGLINSGIAVSTTPTVTGFREYVPRIANTIEEKLIAATNCGLMEAEIEHNLHLTHLISIPFATKAEGSSVMLTSQVQLTLKGSGCFSFS